MKLQGIVPPMTTPFDAKGELELKHVQAQVDWLIAQGAHGLATGGSTGEGHALDAEELRDLIDATISAVKGRIPVVAGIISDSTRDAIRRGKMVAKSGVVALQVTPVHYLFRPSDDAMLQHFKALTEETGMPVLIYNVVPWAYLSPQLLTRIMNEVPGVIGVKQSAGDMKLFADLMITANPRNLIFSAVDALLYSSFTLGAHGAIAAILTAAPRACVELWNATAAGDHKRARAIHEKLLPLWNAMIADNLPANTKYAQWRQGIHAGYPRAPMPAPSAAQRAAVDKALAGLGELVQLSS
ncbi:MAG: dihydrodipicolinate synthase family protein [Alphaproteobacteria bacterium]|nr:dihydrodipicolinate synthase family protein [Alphaproteobacteria bacterium]